MSTWPTNDLGPATSGDRTRPGAVHRVAVGDPARVADRDVGAVPCPARAVAGTAAAVGGDALPERRVGAPADAPRPVAGVRLRLAPAIALLRRHPLRPGPRDAGAVLPRSPAGAGSPHPH